MGRRPLDLDAIRKADADLQRLLHKHPELREAQPEREQELHTWLRDTLDEGNIHDKAGQTSSLSD